MILGLLIVLNPDVLTDPASLGGTPSAKDLIFAFTLTLVTFAGVDASSGLAGEVAVGRKGLKRLMTARMLAFIPYIGISLVAVSALPLDDLRGGGPDDYVDAPMLGVAAAFDPQWLADTLRILIGISAFAILVIACNAAMLGLSRLGYSLALNRQIPSAIGRLHPTRATPVVIIVRRRAAGDPAADPGRRRVPRLDLRVRRDDLVHDRAPVGDPAALARARPRPPVQDPAEHPHRARRAAGDRGARRGAVVRRASSRSITLHGDGALGRRGLDDVRDRALRRLPPLGGQADPQARDDPRARADAPRAPPRPSTARSSCRCSGARSTTTSCRPPGACRRRRTRTRARAAR